MIEEGIVKAIKAGLQAANVNVPGGYMSAELPKDLPSALVPQIWAVLFVTQDIGKSLKGQNSRTDAYIQIDCHGWDGDGQGSPRAFGLAKSIEFVMRGIGPAVLDDADSILLETVFLEDVNDGFRDASRSYIRSLDYSLQFHRN